MDTNDDLQYNDISVSAKSRIDNAMIELVEFHSLKKITVEMVCKKAKVSKSTFYRYYCDIYSAFGNVIQNFTQKCIAMLNNLIRESKWFDINDPVNESLFSNNFFFNSKDKLFFNEYIEKGDSGLLSDLYKVVCGLFAENFSALGCSNDDVSFLSDFFSMAVIYYFIDDYINGHSFNLGLFQLISDSAEKLAQRGGLFG